MFLRTIIAMIWFASLSVYSMECADKVVQEDSKWFVVKLNEYKQARESKKRRDDEVARLKKSMQCRYDVLHFQLATRIGIVHGSGRFQAKL